MNEELDQQFEPGEEEPDMVKIPGPKEIVVSVRLSHVDADRLILLAETSHATVSQVARDAIRAFIARGGQPLRTMPEFTGGTPDGPMEIYAPLLSRTQGPKTAVTVAKAVSAGA